MALKATPKGSTRGGRAARALHESRLRAAGARRARVRGRCPPRGKTDEFLADWVWLDSKANLWACLGLVSRFVEESMTTGEAPASAAGRILNNPKSKPNQKKVAGSDLAQAKPRPTKKK